MDGVNQVDNPLLTRPAGRGRPVSSRKESPTGPPAQAVGRGYGPVEHHLNPFQTPIQLPQEGVGRGRSKSIDQTPNAGHTPSCTTSRLSPHLRKTSESPSTTSESRTISRQVSPQLSEAAPEVVVLSENNTIRKLTTLDAREIFFQEDVRVSQQSGADSKSSSGRIVIYELLDAPVGIWELTIEDKTVIRGDVRNLREMLTDGSKAFLRRLNNGHIKSNPIRFSDVNEAKIFMNEVNLRRFQYPLSTGPTYPETTIELSPVLGEVAPVTAVEPTQIPEHPVAMVDSAASLRQKFDTAYFESTQPKKLELDEHTAKQHTAEKHTAEKHTVKKHTVEDHPAEKFKRSWEAIGPGKREDIWRPRTPPIPLTAAAEQVEPGWHDNDLIRLSPYSFNGSSPSGELINDKPLQTAVTESRSLWEEAGSPSRQLAESPSRQLAEFPSHQLAEEQVELEELVPIDAINEEQETQQEKRRMSAAEATRALRDINIIDDVYVPQDRSGNSLQLPWMNPADYTHLARRSGLLAMALASSPSPTRSAVFLTSLLHLVEIDEFLDLPLDEQKRSLATLYTIIRQSASRIVRTQNEISALRSSAKACPEAIKEFNALVKGLKGSGRGRGEPTPQPPAYNPELVAGGASVNHAFLYGSHRNDSPIGQTPQDTTTANPRSISEETVSSHSSNMLGKGSKGLMKSRWASDSPEQQSSVRGENIPTQYPLSLSGLESVGNEGGRIVDRNANSHGRLGTLDTMSILADQLGSLSLHFKHG